MVPVLVSNLFFEVSILLLDIFLAFGTGLIQGDAPSLQIPAQPDPPVPPPP